MWASMKFLPTRGPIKTREELHKMRKTKMRLNYLPGPPDAGFYEGLQVLS